MSILKASSKTWRRTACAVALALSSQLGHAVAITNLTELGAVPDFAMGINNLGQVTGAAFNPGLSGYSGATLPFIYMQGQLNIIDGTVGYGTAINDAGQIAGRTNNPQTVVSDEQAFVFDANGMHRGGLPGSYGSIANGINAQGQAVGRSISIAGNIATSIIYTPGAGISAIPGAPISSSANDINSAGVVVGTYNYSGNLYHGYILDQGTVTDVGTFGGPFSEAVAINELGQVTGVAHTTDSYARAFVYDKGVLKNIGTLGVDSAGADINIGGDVVGTFYDEAFNPRAFLYTPELGMVDLNTYLGPDSGWVLASAYGINDGRMIVGTGTYLGIRSAFLMTGLMPVPEPGNFILMLLGLAAVVTARRRVASA